MQNICEKGHLWEIGTWEIANRDFHKNEKDPRYSYHKICPICLRPAVWKRTVEDQIRIGNDGCKVPPSDLKIKKEIILIQVEVENGERTTNVIHKEFLYEIPKEDKSE